MIWRATHVLPVRAPKLLHCVRGLMAAGAVWSTAFAAQSPAQPPPPQQDYPQDETILTQGQALFMQFCASCHAVERDNIGPPLGGVTRLLTRDELLGQIRNPAAVI